MVDGMARNKLTDTKVRAAKAPGLLGDGDGLYLRVHPGGTKSWFFIYRRSGVRRELGLGGLEGIAPVGLAQARRKADELRSMLADGKDPYAERATRKRSGALTFGSIVETFLGEPRTWTRHTSLEWKKHLTGHASKLSKVAIDAVSTELVEQTLRPLWDEKPATGQRVRGKIEAVLDYATAKRLRTGDNPARWAGHLEHILAPAQRTTGANHAAMPYRDLPRFWKSLGNDVASRCLAFTIITAARVGEARGATWEEIDRSAMTWTIPASRMKTRREHVVPLTEEALACLPDGTTGFIFKGAKKGRPIGETIVRDIATGGGSSVHGMRSAFADWAGEETDHPREIREWSLSHQVGSAVERAYRRGDALEKRRKLMADWAEFLKSGS